MRRGRRSLQCAQIETLLHAGKSVLLASNRGGIRAEMADGYCAVEFLAPNTSWAPVTELYGIVDELRERRAQ